MRKPYTEVSVSIAFYYHESTGLIRSWSTNESRYIVDLSSGETLVLRSLREAYVFVCGLASAVQAFRKGKVVLL